MAAPLKYNQAYHDDWAWSLAIKGATDVEIAEAFGISVRTLNRWKKDHDSFMVALMSGKGLNGIRADVYQLILKAEHMYNESGTGKQKFEWVIQQARGLLPKWLQVLVTEKAMKEVVQKWFVGVKDLLDDGKVNNSQK